MALTQPVPDRRRLNDRGDIQEVVTDPSFVEDPYPGYALLLDSPGWRSESGYRVFTRYDDCLAIMRNFGSFGQEHLGYPNFHTTDPPEHTRLRRLVSRAFTPRAVAAHQQLVADVSAQLIAELAPHGRMDIVADYAQRLPALVMAEILGVPTGDVAQWRDWQEGIGRLRGVIRFAEIDPAAKRSEEERARDANRVQADYLNGLIESRKGGPGKDLVSTLIEARDGDDQLSNDELLYTLVLLLGAGLHTTSSQIGNTLFDLLSHPDQLELVNRGTAPVGNAVEEGLRFNGALQAEFRVVRVPTEINGVSLDVDEDVMIVNAAANRDPRKFDRPDEFDILRDNAAEHLTFGWGIHRCLGAQLARLELEVAIGDLVTKLHGLRLERGPVRRHRFNRWRGLEALPIRWDTP
jgi:cytochrome P450